ncbi:non-structural maintenance of chromosomes element 4, partial [Phenoliferia sp. Uapishka_3]
MSHSNRFNGKGKAIQSSSDPEEDVNMSDQDQDQEDEEAGEEGGEEEGEGEDQDETVQKKRATRAGFRTLMGELEFGDLSGLVERSNALYKHVTAPSEAILDSRVLMAASDAGAIKARLLKLDQGAFDTDEFLLKLQQFMGGAGNKKPRIRSGGQAEALEEAAELNARWTKVGRVLARESRRVPAIDHMYGPLSIQVKAKKAKQARANYKVDESQRVQGEALTADDVQKDPMESTVMITSLHTLLKERGGGEGGPGMPYFEFIVNPHSFAQTVENMFYFSFLVKECRVCIEIDELDESPNKGDMICYVTDPPNVENGEVATKFQLIFELTQETWRNAIEAYGITESVIPTREGHKAGAAGSNYVVYATLSIIFVYILQLGSCFSKSLGLRGPIREVVCFQWATPASLFLKATLVIVHTHFHLANIHPTAPHNEPSQHWSGAHPTYLPGHM